MADGNVVIEIKGDDSQYKKTVGSLGKTTEREALKSSKALGGIGKAAGIAAKAVGGITVATLGITAAAQKVGMEFEKAMSIVGATSGASAEEMAMLTEKAKEMGATTQFSASQAAEAMNYMAMAGWSSQQMMDGIGGVMSLAAASGEDLGTTADIVTDAMTALGMSTDQAGHFADVLAAAASNANTNVGMMGDTFKYVAPLAGALGYSAEDLSVAIGLMANSGIKSSQAGTALRSWLTRLSKPTKESAEAMKDLGISLTKSDGSMKSLMEITMDARAAFAGLSEAEQAQYAAALAGQEAMSGMLAIVNASDEDFQKLTDSIYGCEGAAQKMAERRMDNLAGDVDILKSSFEGLQIAISESTNGIAREMVQSVSEMFSAMNEAYKTGGLDGMTDAFTKQFPKLLDRVMSGIYKLVQGVTRKLPDVVKSLASALPGMLEDVIGGLPEIADGLFNAAAALAEQLVSDLPRLVPVLVQGVANLAGSVISGAINVIDSTANGFVNLLKEAGLLPKNLDDEMHALFGSVDTSGIKIPDVNVDGEVDVDTYIDKLHTAQTQLQEAINSLGLNESEAKELEDAILKGSGVEALTIALRRLGISAGKAEKVATSIDEARQSIDTALAGYDLDDTTRENIIAYAAGVMPISELLETVMGLKGGDAKKALEDINAAIKAGLSGYDLDDKTIEKIQEYVTAGGTLEGALEKFTDLGDEDISDATTRVREQLNGAFAGYGLDPVQVANIQQYMDEGHSLEEALGMFTDMNTSEIEGASETVKAALNGALAKFDLPDDAIENITEYVLAGGSVEKALDKYTTLEPEQAAAAAEAANTALDDAVTGLAGVPSGTIAKINDHILSGGKLEDALEVFGGLDASEAKEAAEKLQPSLDDLVKIYNSLNLKDISLADFLAACTSAQGSIVGALELLGADDKTIETALTNAELLANSISTRLKGVFDTIKEAFTNGDAADDAKAAADAAGKLETVRETGHEQINTWLDDTITKLGLMGLSADAYAEEVAKATEQATQMHTELDAAIDEAGAWVAENAGARTDEVEARVAELDVIVGRVEAIEARVQSLNNEMTTRDYSTRNAVEQGLLNSEGAQTTAISLTAKEYEKALLEAADEYAQAEQKAIDTIAQADEDLKNGVIDETKYKEITGKAGKELNDALTTRTEAEQKAADDYNRHMQAILQGMIEASPDLSKAIDSVAKTMPTRSAIGDMLEAIRSSMTAGDAAGMTQEEWLAALGMDEATISAVAAAIGVDAQTLKTQLVNMQQVVASGDDPSAFLADAGLALKLQEYADGATQAMADAVSGIIQSGDMDSIAQVWKLAAEQGWLESAQGIDWSNPEEVLAKGLMNAVGIAADEASKEKPGPTIDVEPQPEVDGSTVTEGITEAVEEAAENSTETVEPEVDVEPELTVGDAAEKLREAMLNSTSGMTLGDVLDAAGLDLTDLGPIADAMGTSAGQLTNALTNALNSGDVIGAMAGVFAGVDLSSIGADLGGTLNEGVSSTSGDAEAAGKELADAAATGADDAGAQASADSAGANVGQGFYNGLRSKKKDILELAQTIGNQVSSTIANALKVQSPSKVMEQIGAFTGEGFEIGLRDSLKNAVRTAEDIVGTMDLNTRIVPDFTSAIDGAVNSVYAAENGRPLYLNVNGKTLARVVNDNMRQATNNANRRVGLGVGK